MILIIKNVKYRYLVVEDILEPVEGMLQQVDMRLEGVDAVDKQYLVEGKQPLAEQGMSLEEEQQRGT